jgi:hypothetical protein
MSFSRESPGVAGCVVFDRRSKIAPEGAARLFLVTPRLGPAPGAAVELRLKKD